MMCVHIMRHNTTDADKHFLLVFLYTFTLYHFRGHRQSPAALKCRQRKKAWLAQLQAKVEYLQNENERLTQALVSSREEITRLSALVGAAGVMPGQNVPGAGSHNGVNVNGNGGGMGGTQMVNGAPVSMNVSMNGKAGAAVVGGGRGYGY